LPVQILDWRRAPSGLQDGSETVKRHAGKHHPLRRELLEAANHFQAVKLNQEPWQAQKDQCQAEAQDKIAADDRKNCRPRTRPMRNRSPWFNATDAMMSPDQTAIPRSNSRKSAFRFFVRIAQNKELELLNDSIDR